MDIRTISALQARPIRLEVLRPGRPPSEVVYRADDSELTLHLGAFEDNKLIGIASFFPEACPSRGDARAWRLRGMAVVESARDRGLGGQLLSRGLEYSVDVGVEIVWCNGRTTARSFYERHGFAAVGEEFLIPHSGPHYVFVRQARTVPGTP